jgi:predicted RNase H-like HicB family nuclease
MQITVQFNATLPVKYTKRHRWVLASCPILDVHSQGETAERAKKNLGEALSAFFISCFERGTLDEVLKNCGFKPVHPTPAILSKKLPDSITVPIPFLVNQPKSLECHA